MTKTKPLSKRDAALRADALSAVIGAARWLYDDTAVAIMYDHPRRAIQRIEQQEARLRRAKAALRKLARVTR